MSYRPIVLGFLVAFFGGGLFLALALFVWAPRFTPKPSTARRARIVWQWQDAGSMVGSVVNVGSEPLDHLVVTACHYEPVYANGFNIGSRPVAVNAAVEIVTDSGKPWDLRHPPESIRTTLIRPGSSGGVIIGATQADLNTIDLVSRTGDRQERIPFTQEIDPTPLQLAPGSGTTYYYGR